MRSSVFSAHCAVLMGMLAACSAGSVTFAQCTNNNTAIAGGAITPPCPGTMVVPCVQAGQYALVNVTNGNIYNFNTCAATFDTQITLFNNAGGGALANNDDFCGAQSQVVWTANYTGQLRVLVDRWTFLNACAHTGGCAPLSITCNLPPPPMTNDNCPTAIPLPVLSTCTMLNFTNAGSTASGALPAPTCGSAPNTDVWFSFTAPASGQVVIRTEGLTLTNAVMQLYSGACGSLALVPGGCNDTDPNGSLMPKLDFRCATLVPFATYYIRLWGSGGSTGVFRICVSGYATTTTPQEDCAGGSTICGDQAINNTSDFAGCTQDLGSANDGCLAGEQQGTWYFFSPSASGTVALAITPSANIDYDFAIWGPMSTISCPPVGNPIRCSWALPPHALGYTTGMGNGAADASEGAGGNGWVAPLPVVTGLIYIMYVDNYDLTGQPFVLDWTLSNGASLDCTVLPIELVYFEGAAAADHVLLSWSTQTEYNSDRFIVERSSNGSDFVAVGSLEAAGSSVGVIDYAFKDLGPMPGTGYYRLRMIDRDGTSKLSDVISVNYRAAGTDLVLYPSPAQDKILIDLRDGVGSGMLFLVSDAQGRVVSDGKLISSEQRTAQIDLTGLDAGIYLLELRTAGGSILGSGRFMKE
ncbi:MAG: T9SS type A sorting domain-containing protein [Flavobacteriales bacterium]|nr:T9SS type A sorting domain-containing protein [Flavobacteriales bacterium]